MRFTAFEAMAKAQSNANTAVPLLIVPGYRGSGPDHWQSWLQLELTSAQRFDGVDWDNPVLAIWSAHLRKVLAAAPRPVRIVAHSFGCLAAVVAAADRPELVADLILVAPADPRRFDFIGLKTGSTRSGNVSLADALPRRSLHVGGMLVASRNDPWLDFADASALAGFWGLDLHDAGHAGHINADSGHGTWPALLELLAERSDADAVTRRRIPATGLKKGRGSTLAAVRQLTREQLEKPNSRKFQTSGVSVT